MALSDNGDESDEPLFLDASMGRSDSEPLTRAFDRTGKRPARAISISSDPIILLSSSSSPADIPPPAPGRTMSAAKQRYTPFVDIPLLPLSAVRKYRHAYPLQPPNYFTRKQLFVAPAPAASTTTSSSRSSSVVPIALTRPKREVTRKVPTWQLQPAYDDHQMSDDSVRPNGRRRDVGGYEDEEGEEELEDDEEGYSLSEDEVGQRRSKRHRARSFDRTSRNPRNLRSYPIAISVSSGSSRSPSQSSVRSRKRKRGRPRRDGMRPEPRNTRRKYDVEDDDSEFDINGIGKSEGEDELEEYELISDDEERRKGKTQDPAEAILVKHRPFCEKCLRGRADVLLETALKRKKKAGKKRKKDEDELSDEELAEKLEGWLECRKCVVASHWGCLAPTQQKFVLSDLLNEEGPPREGQKARKSVKIGESADFTCARCTASPACFVCHEEKIGTKSDQPKTVNGEGSEEKAMIDVDAQDAEANGSTDHRPADGDGDVDMDDIGEASQSAPIFFRCRRCKQGCHYEHLNDPFTEDEEHDLADIAEFYQRPEKGHDEWFCHQCREWVWAVDSIRAWRPSPPHAVESKREAAEKPNAKETLPREYLIKWAERGFRHVTWVPHAWLQIIAFSKLRNFLERGPSLDLITDETLAAKGDEMDSPTIARVMEEDDQVKDERGDRRAHGIKSEWGGHGPPPDVNAEASIPPEWSTVDRVLDIMLLPPNITKKKPKPKPEAKRSNRILSLSPSPTPDTVEDEDFEPVVHSRPDGIQPPPEERVDIDEWEKGAGRTLTEKNTDEVANLVTWCFVKWNDLQYDQSCWDTPPPIDSPLYVAFKHALRRYLRARQTDIPVLTAAERRERDAEASRPHVPPDSQPDCIVGGKLMPFQMEGFQWLLYKHLKRESCILADDMGLGKTIQIASLLGYLGSSAMNIYPCLVIVPNSTITNWVREFEKWVPHIRVVPYYGEAASRKIISKYELYHKGLQNKPVGLKAHVVLTTYDMITGQDFRVFASIPRWEVLCVDEGQRLKSDSNLIFNRLKQLNSVHRILLTGTPLNNNLRELFNLLNFLDPDAFRDLNELEERFEKLNESLIQELHEMIKPYILRRIKADVLKLPPKVEIIVPISLSPLQKNLYKGILERNAEVLKAIAEARRRKAKAAGKTLTNGTTTHLNGAVTKIANGHLEKAE